MFGPYMMLHVLFFLAVLWDITEDKDVSALYVCTPTDPEPRWDNGASKKKKNLNLKLEQSQTLQLAYERDKDGSTLDQDLLFAKKQN